MTIFENSFTVVPGANGSFVISDLMHDSRMIGTMRGFTNVNDLLTWLQQQAREHADNLAKVPGDVR